MNQLRPVPVALHGAKNTFVHKDLSTCSHVFVRRDAVRRPLQQPYDGPFLVLERHEKFYKLRVKDVEVVVSVDRLKPAFLPATTDPPSLPSTSTPQPPPLKKKSVTFSLEGISVAVLHLFCNFLVSKFNMFQSSPVVQNSWLDTKI
uniref:Uncharacterized protein n=2 Tax=Lygus hesperus TaxID=30085 RepID=A0A0K8SX31_LYGHE